MHMKFIEPSRNYVDIIFQQDLDDDIIKQTLYVLLKYYDNKSKTNF